jgi:hypothetical protein
LIIYSVFSKDTFSNPPVANTDPIFEHVQTDSNKVLEEIEWNSDRCNIWADKYPSHFGQLDFRHQKIRLEKSDNADNIPRGESFLLTFDEH